METFAAMTRDPADVPCTFISDPADLPLLAAALHAAVRVAIDTETPIDGPMAQQLRVASVATRDATGNEQSFVVDARAVSYTHLTLPTTPYV